MLSVVILCVPISISGLNFITVILLVVLFALVAIWHFNYAYFGEVLRPDSLSLLIKPDHFRDVVSVGSKEFHNFWPTILVMALSFSAALIAISWTPDHTLQGPFALIAWGALLFAGARILFRLRPRHEWPDIRMVGLVGGLHALVVALKWRMSPVSALPGAVTYTMRSVQDALVVILMGESINPARMGVFSDLKTTPRMNILAAGSHTLKGFARVGFSAAVASNASVSGFLSGSPFPWRTSGSRSLFDLARDQGFATRYWSGQTRSPVELLGDRRVIDDVYSFESAPAAFRNRKDWHLLDKLEPKPLGKREFAFIYPRCNHSPHLGHGVDPSGDGSEAASSELVTRYDAGMRVFDAFVSDLVEQIETSGRRVFIVITSDHNELLGDRESLKGHNLSGHAAGALVPYLLITNDPDNEAVREFSSIATPSAWNVAEFALKVMGVEARVEPDPDGIYVCNSLPFGRAGYMKLSGPDGLMRVENHDRSGKIQSTRTFAKEGWLNRKGSSNAA